MKYSEINEEFDNLEDEEFFKNDKDLIFDPNIDYKFYFKIEKLKDTNKFKISMPGTLINVSKSKMKNYSNPEFSELDNEIYYLFKTREECIDKINQLLMAGKLDFIYDKKRKK
jgi:hypothetical protein